MAKKTSNTQDPANNEVHEAIRFLNNIAENSSRLSKETNTEVVEDLVKDAESGKLGEDIAELEKAINQRSITTAEDEEIKQILLNAFSEIKQLFDSNTWKLYKAVAIIAGEPNLKAAEKMQFFADMQPYIETELQKKSYNGSNIFELFINASKNEDGLPIKEDPFYRAIVAASAAKQLDNGDIESVKSGKIDSVIYPIDKVNSVIWNLLEEDTNGQITIALESTKDKRKGKELSAVYSIDFDALGNDITITKRLTPLDKRVYVAISALFKDGYSYMSLTQIYRAMGYIKNPSRNDLEKINDSITKMQKAAIYVNNTQEAAVYNFPQFVYDGSLLPMERKSAFVNGQLVESAIHVFREPPIMSFAKQRDQVTTVTIKMLQSPINKTNDNLQLEDYLIERLARAKRAGKEKERILFKTLHERTGVLDGTPSAVKKKIQRLPDRVKKYLDYYKECGYIKRHTLQTDGITVFFK